MTKDAAKTVTLPQRFKQAGYNASGAGKVFHPGIQTIKLLILITAFKIATGQQSEVTSALQNFNPHSPPETIIPFLRFLNQA
jgi:hypothetical protein